MPNRKVINFIHQYYWLIGGGIVLLLHLPFFLFGEGVYINNHDNLDSDFIYLHLLKTSNNLFNTDSSALIMNIFNGLPRDYIHSEYNFLRILFYIFPSFWAYVVNSILIRSIGFAGLSLLARDYFGLFSSSNNKLAVFFCSIIFVLLPILPIYGLSVMGQPLLLWAFLNLLYRRRTIFSFGIIVLFPFYAHIAFTAPFVLIAFSLLGFFRVVYYKQGVTKQYIGGILLLLVSFLVANQSLLMNMLSPTEVSHRKEFVVMYPSSLYDFIIELFQTICFNQYHSAAMNLIPLLLMGIYCIAKKMETRFSFILVSISLVFIPIFYVSYNLVFETLLNKIHSLHSLHLHRFTFLMPLLVFCFLFLCLQNDKIRKNWIYITAFILLFPNPLRRFQEIGNNWLKPIPYISSFYDKFPSFDEFYAPKLFAEIKNHINRKQADYRVVSVGIHPAIAQYNGFFTLDSYQNNYPLKYKHQFRRVIAKELDKNQVLKEYFDNWGSRCYVFSADLKENCYLDCHAGLDLLPIDLELDLEVLKKMGATYIFSAVPINTEKLPIVLDKIFTQANSRWKIYLYRL